MKLSLVNWPDFTDDIWSFANYQSRRCPISPLMLFVIRRSPLDKSSYTSQLGFSCPDVNLGRTVYLIVLRGNLLIFYILGLTHVGFLSGRKRLSVTCGHCSPHFYPVPSHHNDGRRHKTETFFSKTRNP